MWIDPVTLPGRVARLEPLEKKHAGDLLAAADPELFRFTPQAPPEWSLAGFEKDIQRVRNLPGTLALAIMHADTGKAIGRTTYMDIQAEHRGVEIGRTWIARPHHGTMVNPEIKYLMLAHAFEGLTPTAARVAFTTGGQNLHSQTAIAKLGAVKEGVIRKSRVVPGGPKPTDPKIFRDTVYYSILENEWPTVKARLEARIGWSLAGRPAGTVHPPVPITPENFEACTIPLDRWNHRAHVTVATMLIQRHGLAQATRRMCEALKTFTAHHGIAQTPTGGYHETLSVVWIKLIDATMQRHGPVTSVDEFLDQNTHLLSKTLPRLYYSKDRMMSPEARHGWVEPDLAPFPRTPDS